MIRKLVLGLTILAIATLPLTGLGSVGQWA